MASSIRFTSLPDPSKVDKLEEVIESLKSRLERRELDYSELVVEVLDNLKGGMHGTERLDQLRKLRISWQHLQTIRLELRNYFKKLRQLLEDELSRLTEEQSRLLKAEPSPVVEQQMRLLEAELSRIAEELGSLNVDGMAWDIQASEISKACYESPIKPLFEPITESPLEVECCSQVSKLGQGGESD
ncbi:hypothetical protein IL306_000701 [Fusarium sp. DS 682]|nr:hypothetical protein IL306_000701 [Fusarium sp. DS 682]